MQPLTSAFPWYDLREVRPANDRLWAGVRERLLAEGVAAPNALTRGGPVDAPWRSGRLLLGQACGYDVLLAYREALQLVATPWFRAPGCRGPLHASYVVVRAGSPFRVLEDLRGARCVINTPTSHSGRNVLRAIVAPFAVGGRFFSRVRRSGSHESSLRAIRAGRADVAAIDCVTWALLAKHRPRALEDLVVLASSAQVPAPPFVTAASTPPEVVLALRAALDGALADPDLATARDALALERVEPLPLDAYGPIADLEHLAERHGYAELDRRRPRRA